jgi:hypothetical protein
MPTEVKSPVSQSSSKVGSIRSGDLSPVARSNPSRGDARVSVGSVPAQPAHGGGGRVAPHQEEPGEVKITGPKEE